ncbi:nuclear transcription factor Y subunit A-7-like isoform X1 [Nymphaea colorata]|nr:nuclear transcription factor Y subunit A-7-like isoform X1 [Nymphaea colorata]XP_031505180.1 nuclear transcription factor Y subunit A-7-like isoform X1 [Nymphaea colorata]XP_031505181.1 nuclear transcription factor Y subunit A-7-like isoform X1 [Nymphaea colorata]XP_031505183.1 nuclear transcription factor Y subunit A-7-like isoform X1 [Nymphaea colorata]XP_031505184.1 nuclear transcription factor Y subunit A-7-like isoform X1 [Nymphaea colorata]XP_031505185.1 nuclear transcription factor Y
MTSSVPDSRSECDSAGTDEHQNQSHMPMQPQSPSTGIYSHGVAGPSVEYIVPHTHPDIGHTMGQAVYPFPDPYYGSYVAAYGAQVMIHPHMMGVHQGGLPLPSDAVEEPVYVNAKQYHGILRRRQSRAKAESENKMIKSRKPYLHESRHLHALRRARGCGGRFLNSKTEAHEIQASGGAPPSQPISTSNSDDS